MPTVYVLIGLPGSGKSTWRTAHLAANPNDEYVICSTDDMIDEWAAERGLTYAEAFTKAPMKHFNKLFKSKFEEAIAAGKNVIVDRTNMTVKRRKEFITDLPEGYDTVGVVFTVTDQELARRLKDRAEATGKFIPEHVVKEMANRYQAPEPGEFGQLVDIKPFPQTLVA